MSAAPDRPMKWIKSTFSANNGTCVEVELGRARTAARDSKNVDGPVLDFPSGAFVRFLGGLRG
ncbi:MAG: DUF397 domain-containing protein [Actinomycetota bacterium]|nr:DUF397 domain-containing protein [Actinomycetota bacterium]